MRDSLLIRRLLILGTLLLVGFFAILTSGPTGSLVGTKVCIDPGHGDLDPGAVNEAFGLWESEINLDVAYGLKALLEAEGAEVVLTRSDDSGKSDQERSTYCNEQRATILVSVHTNSVNTPWLNGSLALYFDEDDKALAQAIYDELHLLLKETAPGPAYFMRFGLDNFTSALLRESEMPAVIMEPLLMSNPSEAELLVKRIYLDPKARIFSEECIDFDCRRGQIVRALYQGVLNYFGDEELSPATEGGRSVHLVSNWR